MKQNLMVLRSIESARDIDRQDPLTVPRKTWRNVRWRFEIFRRCGVMSLLWRDVYFTVLFMTIIINALASSVINNTFQFVASNIYTYSYVKCFLFSPTQLPIKLTVK